MNKKFIIIFIFVVGFSFAQVKRIQFSYDITGNQTQRVICPNCPAKNTNYLNEQTLLDKDLIQENNILYYPNPVREELYLKWKTIDNNDVISIEIYSMTGQQLKKIVDVKNEEINTINFSEYPSGYYNLMLVYSNGDKKDLKIVKK